MRAGDGNGTMADKTASNAKDRLMAVGLSVLPSRNGDYPPCGGGVDLPRVVSDQ